MVYAETVIASLNFRENGLDAFIEAVAFYVINRLRHYREESVIDDVPQWLKMTVETMHDKTQFGEYALEMPHYSVTVIAREASYSSPSLIIKTFKK
ncbi:AraC family transcriptional regulator, cel operon repressor [Kosakonia arachidis]|uniref:AraC family transcriptional regulator, cel operon repressor n=1 Tax=Kosakonia arachidis TaxID=551989 RepID=A0A1I7AZK1_9ENTR|nr:AraC family transcriptional regulator, cel operon repressor [Kosakonia arachidis]